MQPSGILSLLTDFGLSDPFVGVMKGVILDRFPSARIIDLCHDVPPQAVDEAGFWLERSFSWFPRGTVHVVVVDPGVGTERAALAVEASGHGFLGPDNGVFSRLLRRAAASPGDPIVRKLDPDRLGLPAPSRTFHGRDVFAPIAALVASGAQNIADLGPAIVPLASDARETGVLDGRVITVDRFGNLITDILLESVAGHEASLVVVDGLEVPLRGTYAEVSAGSPVALVNSFGTIEIAVRDGSAEQLLGFGRGARVELVRR